MAQVRPVARRRRAVGRPLLESAAGTSLQKGVAVPEGASHAPGQRPLEVGSAWRPT